MISSSNPRAAEPKRGRAEVSEANVMSEQTEASQVRSLPAAPTHLPASVRSRL